LWRVESVLQFDERFWQHFGERIRKWGRIQWIFRRFCRQLQFGRASY
jgi:hypothetical protein